MPATFHGVIGAVGALAHATGRAYVVVDAVNAGGLQNLGTALPSLDADRLDILSDGPLILGYGTRTEAQAAFNTLTAEAIRGYDATQSAVETTVTYVGPVEGMQVVTTSNTSGPQAGPLHGFFGGRVVNVAVGPTGIPVMGGIDPGFARG